MAFFLYCNVDTTKMITAMLLMTCLSSVVAGPVDASSASVSAPQDRDTNIPLDGYLVKAGTIPADKDDDYDTDFYPNQISIWNAPYPLILMSVITTVAKFLGKVVLFFVGGVALFFIGGLFTTVVCSLTRVCTIRAGPATFPASVQDSTRSMLAPENISAAADIVEDAIGKYKRLQRAVSDGF